jgi:hypothetical protein
LGTLIDGKALHPGVNILGAIDFAGLVDFCIRGYCFFDEAADLFLIRGVPFDRFDDQTMRGTSGLLSQRAKPSA